MVVVVQVDAGAEWENILVLGMNKEHGIQSTDWRWKSPWIEIQLSLTAKKRSTTWWVAHGRSQRSLGVDGRPGRRCRAGDGGGGMKEGREVWGGQFIISLCSPTIQGSVGIGLPLAVQRNKGMTRLDFFGTCKE